MRGVPVFPMLCLGMCGKAVRARATRPGLEAFRHVPAQGDRQAVGSWPVRDDRLVSRRANKAARRYVVATPSCADQYTATDEYLRRIPTAFTHANHIPA